MFKRLIAVCLLILSAYVVYIYFKINNEHVVPAAVVVGPSDPQAEEEKEQYKIFNFSFSKYNMAGDKELEIEGESANMLTKIVKLNNVIAKAYADDMPVTITADDGDFDKSTSTVHLENNVIATTDDGVRLKTDTLDIHADTNTIETESFTEIEREDVFLEGVGAKCEQNFKKIEFKENVRVIINEGNESSIVITCDGLLEIDYGKNVATFNDNVIAVDSNGRLKSDFMDVYYDKELKDVDRIYAYGDVEISQNDNQTYCDNVLYLTKEGRIILGGDPEAYVSSIEDSDMAGSAVEQGDKEGVMVS